MRIPKSLRDELRITLWDKADELGWQGLTWAQKSPLYEAWTRDPEIGGRLSHYVDQRRIRVYLKDTIMKGYVRARQADPERPLKAVRIDPESPMAEAYERPHGRRLEDGRVISWGNADDWKLVLMAVHERSYDADNGVPFASVLFSANGKYAEPSVREVVQDAANMLRIKKLVWLH